MKRSIRIIALLLVLMSVFMVPVSADEGDNDNWIDVLDYCTPNDSGSVLVTVGANGSVRFDHGITLHGWYVDIVCGITGTIPSSVSITYGSLTRELTMVHVGGSVYRFYGTLSGYASSAPVINFTSTGTSYVSFVSFDICCVSSEHFSDIASGTLSPDGGTTTTKTMASSSSSISWTNVSAFELTLICSNWRKYDYLDFMINVIDIGAITSISASLNGVNVPCEVSFIENGNVLWTDIDGEMYYEGFDYYINVRLDLRGLDRTSSVSPQLHITGGDASGGGYLYVTSCNGYIVAEGVNPLVYHFRKLQLNLSSWFASLEQSMLDNLASMKQFLYTKFRDVTDRLDTLIGGTTEGDELEAGSAQIEEDASSIHDYEQSQQEILTNSLPEIQNTVILTGFTTALAFVQKYTNLTFTGISDFSIVFTMPMLLGLFFYICSRIPGATRWRSKPPKGGGKE